MPKFDKPKKKGKRVEVYKDTQEEAAAIAALTARTKDEAPARGSTYDTGTEYDAEPLAFETLALGRRTALGLVAGKFTHMTRIQAAAIPHALAGRDVLGAAKTGSGKTLAFLVPCLEALWRAKWSAMDGLGALVVCPTRELAIQIFDVLRLVGQHHTFSAGLLIGGKKEFMEEQKRVASMSLLVATPGRLLQHLEQTPGFDASNLQVLVLDEADRILDMGFRDQLTSILSYLPTQRQTLLFSATQTKSVKDLARLSLKKDVEYVAVHAAQTDAEGKSSAVPSTLEQSYMVVGVEDKLDALFSFIKAHLKAKTVVFFATCSQVRFVYECFRTLQPGVPLLALHGKHKQARRTFTFMSFLEKPAAVLFCTDVAARGLDFPAVDWVLQADAPEDAAMYIHRVGRTARNQARGKSLLLALPSEERGLMALLDKAKVPLPKKLAMNPNMRVSLAQKAAAVNASRPETRKLASKAFVSYLRCLHLMPNKEVFDAAAVDKDALAASLGLATQPPLKFLAKGEVIGSHAGEGGAEGARAEGRKGKNANKKLELLKAKIKEEKRRKKRMRDGAGDDDADDAGGGKEKPAPKPRPGDGGLLVKKAPTVAVGDDTDEPLPERRPKKAKKEAKLRVDATAGSGGLRANTKVAFDDETGAASVVGGQGMEAAVGGVPAELGSATSSYQEQVRRRLAATAELDREESKSKLREKKNKRRWADNDDEEAKGQGKGAALGSPGDDEGSGEDGSGGDSGSEGEEGENDDQGDEEEEASDDSDSDSDDDDDSSDEDEPAQEAKSKAKPKAPAMSVEDTEAAVLRLLRGGK